MELWTTLQEDPTLQKIGTDIKEKKRQFVELRAIARTLAPIQRFAELTKGKQLQTQIEDLQRKYAIQKGRTKPWTKEAIQLTLSVQEKLKTI